MTKKSLQQIEDYYIQKGLSSDKLRQVLLADAEYQEILKARKSQLKNEVSISPEEERKYVLSTDQDYEILGKIHKLESGKMSSDDRRMTDFIRTQLEDDWRTPILKLLDELVDKYE